MKKEKKATSERFGFLKKKERKHRFSLTLVFSIVVFAILLAAIAFAGLTVWIFTEVGIIGDITGEVSVASLIVCMGIFSLVIGASISMLLGKIPLLPVNDLINHMNRLARGDYHTRLKFGGAIANHRTFNEISDSFNMLAEELENTEMLRGDFINNFSHEFKTPIVSIAGLAKLVSKGNLTDEQRTQYLNAIEEESLRLAAMATNVLNLTKIENQTILSDVSEFNLSEQIRSCVLLLENKWTAKDLELQIDFDEHMIQANEELLKQVWINLVDNAIKFSPRCGTVSITIGKNHDRLTISVGNTGSEISEENQKNIWKKFYQADESHSSEGNGIGLAIVKRIVELHNGQASVKSGDGMTTFTVAIPLRQN